MREKTPGFDWSVVNVTLQGKNAKKLSAPQIEYQRRQKKYLVRMLGEALKEDVVKGSVPFESEEEYINEIACAIKEEDVAALRGPLEKLAGKIRDDAFEEDFLITFDWYIADKRREYGGDQISPEKEETLLRLREQIEEIFEGVKKSRE